VHRTVLNHSRHTGFVCLGFVEVREATWGAKQLHSAVKAW
jgi:hypothetical protein